MQPGWTLENPAQQASPVRCVQASSTVNLSHGHNWLNNFIMLKSRIITLILFFIFCSTVEAQNIQTEIRPKIKSIVSDLRKTNTIHLGLPVGISGYRDTSNEYYKLYQRLAKEAIDYELVLLTGDSSETIVMYSFLSLYSRNYCGLKEIFVSHIKDETLVRTAGGCTGSIDRINSRMLKLLNPEYSKYQYLTQKEYDQFFNQIGQMKFSLR